MLHYTTLLLILTYVYRINAQDIATIMSTHQTNHFKASTPISEGTSSDCFVMSDKTGSKCLIPTADATTLPTDTLILRRGNDPIDISFILKTFEGTISIDFEAAPPGVPEDVPAPQHLSSSNTLTFTCEDPIGTYLLKSQGKTIQRIILLFNPFAEECAEYLDGVDGDEYILATQGLIWQGFSDNHEAHIWNFDQFNSLNLMASLHLLRRLSITERASPVAVARGLSLSINADMCLGKWGEGEYESGNEGNYQCADHSKLNEDDQFMSSNWVSKCTDPEQWTSTTELTEQFWARHLLIDGKHSKTRNQLGRSKETNIQYCQCFVFAGVLTTMGRALGIATRPYVYS